MQRNYLGKTARVLFIGIACLAMWLTSGSVIAADIQVTVGQSTTLINRPANVNTDSITCSRTGQVAVFYPGIYSQTMRVSNDAGLTWGPEKYAQNHDGGAMEIGLSGGGVIKFGTDTSIQPEDGSYMGAIFTWSDDFDEYQGYFLSKIFVPNSQRIADIYFPGVSKGPIIQIPDGYSGYGVSSGDLLMPMHGALTGDNWVRSYLVHSTDLGHTWNYRESIAYLDADPYPETGGQWLGMAEPTIALLPNGQLLAVIRSNGDPAGPNNQFKPLYTAWSDDLGLTWTDPIRAAVDPAEETDYLYSNSPTLAVLDNGVVAVSYGRPGFHVAFSTDNGHTWGDIIEFSDLSTIGPPYPNISGQFDMVQVAPNKLVAVGCDYNGYLKVWPITVDLGDPPPPPPPSPPLYGDFDEDGDVDSVDFSHWQMGYPTTSGSDLDHGDADGDGDTDGVDFGLWQENYGATGTAPAALTIPEPASISILLIGALALLKRRRVLNRSSIS